MGSVERSLKRDKLTRRNFLKGTGLASAGLVSLLGESTADGTPTRINTKWKIERILWPEDIELPEHINPITEAHSVNEAGEVVGFYGAMGRTPYYLGFFIHRNGVTRGIKLDEDYALFSGSQVGLYSSRINNLGDILVGNVVYRRNNDKIVLNSEPIEIDFKVGIDLNDHCDVVAYAPDQAYLFTNGEEIGLGFFASSYSLAINNNRQIIGSYHDAGHFWENGEITHPARTKDEENVTLISINNDGTFIGREGCSKYWCWNKIWRNKGQDVEPLSSWDYPKSINDSELVVGGVHYRDAYISNVREKVKLYGLLPEEAKYRELGSGFQPGWTALREATSINNKGQIVGYGYFVDEEGVSKRQGFIMTPIKLEGDLNDDNKIDAGDFAEFANKWLEDWNYDPDSEPPPSR